MITLKELEDNILSSISEKDKNPKYSRLVKRAFELEYLGEDKQALFILNEIKREVNHHDLYYFEATIYRSLGNNVEVVESCKKGLELKETYYLYDKIGVSYDALDKEVLAIEMFDKAIELNDSVFELYYDKAISLSNLSKYNEAIVSFDKVISINPSFPNTYFEKGYSLFKLEDYNKAFESYKKYVSLRNDREGYYYLALVIYESDYGIDEYEEFDEEYEAALLYINKGISIMNKYDKFDASYLSLKADILFMLDREKEAFFCYNTVINNKNSSINGLEIALSNLSFNIKSKNKELALAYINRALNLTEISWYFILKGKILYKLKDYNNAIISFNKALEVSTDENNKNVNSELEDAYHYLSLVEFRRNNIKNAIDFINNAIGVKEEKKFVNLKKYLESL